MDLLSTNPTPDRSCKHCTVAILEATQMTTREKWACVEQRPDNANPVMAAFCASMVALGPNLRMSERADEEEEEEEEEERSVPTKSDHSCKKCRKDKKGCDKTIPICGRCEDKGATCVY